jgi:hypothetical protein
VAAFPAIALFSLVAIADGKPVATFPAIALFPLVAIAGGKPVATFPAIALFPLSQSRTENRWPLFLQLL